jgi:anti-sigma-K factor RskA
MNLEDDLRLALHRQSPPPGFAARVLERIEREARAETRRRPAWWRAVAASVIFTAVAGGWTAHTIHQRREGERAKEQLVQAMRIAGEKVHYAQQEVRAIGSRK